MADSFDEIIKSIFSQLNGDPQHDVPLLMAAGEQYKDHPQAKEILREVGRKIYEILPDEAKADVDAAVTKDQNETEEKLRQTFLAMQAGNTTEALAHIEPLAQKLRELQRSGVCADDSQSSYYDFRDFTQLVLIGELIKPKGEIRKAIAPFAQVYSAYASVLFEVGKHEEAIHWLKEAIRWNPVETSLYFEIDTNFKALGNLEAAYEWDMRAHKFIADASSLAHWYRNLGFISIERGEFELAAAEFVFSMVYEPTELAFSELMYMRIEHNADYVDMSPDDAASILEKHDIALGANQKVIDILTSLYAMYMDNGEHESACKTAFDLYGLTAEDTWHDAYEALLSVSNEE